MDTVNHLFSGPNSTPPVPPGVLVAVEGRVRSCPGTAGVGVSLTEPSHQSIFAGGGAQGRGAGEVANRFLSPEFCGDQ